MTQTSDVGVFVLFVPRVALVAVLHLHLMILHGFKVAFQIPQRKDPIESLDTKMVFASLPSLAACYYRRFFRCIFCCECRFQLSTSPNGHGEMYVLLQDRTKKPVFLFSRPLSICIGTNVFRISHMGGTLWSIAIGDANWRVRHILK
jgi:hypothetical protein